MLESLLHFAQPSAGENTTVAGYTQESVPLSSSPLADQWWAWQHTEIVEIISVLNAFDVLNCLQCIRHTAGTQHCLGKLCLFCSCYLQK